MRPLTYKIEELRYATIPLGFAGENQRTQIRLDCTSAFEEFPAAVASITAKAPTGEKYPVVSTRSGNFVIWTGSDADLAHDGDGEMEVTFVEGETIAKTYRAKTKITESMGATGPAPDPVANWMTEANAALAEIPATINAALEAAKESGEFDGPPGADGRDGTDGQDGYSPTATVTKSGNVTTITITDKTGTTTETVSDGQNGTDGQDGQDGQSAYVYIRYAANQPTADADMKTEPDAWIGIHSGAESTAPTHYTDYAWYKITGENGAPGAVQDVQVNGTSILQNGVANIPVAAWNKLGTVKPNPDYGTVALDTSSASPGTLQISKASDSNLKSGSNQYKPIVPSNQHLAAFYGLAKAAGADLANETVTMGKFPNNAKGKICNMIGAEGKLRLLRTIDISEEIDTIGFDTDKDGLPFNVDRILVVALIKPCTGEKTLTFGIETTAITSSGSKWVGKHTRGTNATKASILFADIRRTPYRWQTEAKRYISSTTDLTTAIITDEFSTCMTINGASWIRTNNPEYATSFSINIANDVFPVGTRFEIYAHDYYE